jgi:glutathione S-transferase
LLKLVEKKLFQSGFWVGEQPTIADIAFYSYVAHAPEGNVSLADYPHVRAWLASIDALPGFVGMPRTAAGLQSQ